MKVFYYIALAGLVALSSVEVAAADSRDQIAVTIGLTNVFGEPVDSFKVGEPFWLVVEVKNSGEDPVTLVVPPSPSLESEVRVVEGSEFVATARPRFFADQMARKKKLDSEESFKVPLFAGEQVKFIQKGRVVIDVRLGIRVGREKLRPETLNVEIVGEMELQECERMLARMKAAFDQSSQWQKPRFLWSLESLKSDCEGWGKLLDAGLNDAMDEVALETVSVLSRSDLSREQQRRLLTGLLKHQSAARREAAAGALLSL